MRIALIHDWLTGMRGGEKCLEILCRRFPDARLFTLLHIPGATSPAIDRMAITTSILQRIPGAGRHYRWLLPLMPRAVERLRIPADVDLVVSLSHAVAKNVRPPSGVPHVCYCFTPIRYAWHRREDYFAPRRPVSVAPRHQADRAEASPPHRGRNTPCAVPDLRHAECAYYSGVGGYSGAGGLVLRILSPARDRVLDRIRDWDRAASSRVTQFVAISRTVAGRIADAYGRTSRVIYPPVDTRFYTPDAAPREDWYLCVSALVPYKRIDLAIAACNRLGRRLVVIGAGPEHGRLARLAGPTVRLLGWRTNEEIRDHLRRARALVFPANEDFGIVPLEAQACATPVIAFGQGGATETVLPVRPGRPGTGWFFDEQTPESLLDAIGRFESQRVWFDPALARLQAERFAADRFERELIEYLEETAFGKGPMRIQGTKGRVQGPGHGVQDFVADGVWM